ncbi:hypothetical protein SAMN02799616_05215 [Paenibacillus sp. UNC499MF]|nr:hypothetical protein SAMN02799616_05215 [Paenibacillus sp. UNC499MF]
MQKRLKGKELLFLIDLAKRVVDDYGAKASQLLKLLQHVNSIFTVSEVTRRNILDELYSRGKITGKYDLIEFLNRIWNLEQMPSSDSRFKTASGDIWQHMINNSDWDEVYLFERYLELVTSADETFIKFLEQVVHPLIREQDEQDDYINFINKHLSNDGYKLFLADNISGYPVYKVMKLEVGVKGKVKNLIFAAIGHKPEIIFSDSINNDIKIIKHEENCLVYDCSILHTGLLWNDLITWWADIQNIENIDQTTEISLYKRLYSSLDSLPEKILFKWYFKFFREMFDTNFPALIPQVYLHYDPYTIKQRTNETYLPRQRMDFLLLFSNKQRIVLEVDGKQHYSDGDISSPKKYAEMAKADRDLKLNGYEVYRFGGIELNNETESPPLIKDFFVKLFNKHGIKRI